MKKTQELYNIIRQDDKTGARVYVASIRDIYSGMASTANISARRKSDAIDFSSAARHPLPASRIQELNTQPGTLPGFFFSRASVQGIFLCLHPTAPPDPISSTRRQRQRQQHGTGQRLHRQPARDRIARQNALARARGHT